MNWDAVGAIAEMIGAIAVIVSILYLAMQVRQGAADVRANIIHSLHSNEVELSSKPSTDLNLANALEKLYTNLKLDDGERAQYTMWIFSQWMNYQQVYLEYQRLNVDADIFEALRIRLAGSMEPRLSHAIWDRLKNRFTPQFQTYVQKHCLEIEMNT